MVIQIALYKKKEKKKEVKKNCVAISRLSTTMNLAKGYSPQK